MKIILGSTNVSKQRSILIAMKELGFDDKKIEIIDRKNLDNNGIGNSMAIILTLGIIIVILIIIIAFSLLKK